MTTATLCFEQPQANSSFASPTFLLAQAAIIVLVKIKATGEAGEFVASICYRTPQESAAFLAGEMDGPENSLSCTCFIMVNISVIAVLTPLG